MNRPADWQAREAALDPARSFIVQAPAGSGKTELLTQRMLRLLAGVENPEEVVAITFTRKAAAEMAHRLVGHLRQAAAAVDESALKPHERRSRELAIAVLENDRKRGWELLEQPGRLRVRTIDSLCGELARQLPILSGLGGGQSVTERADDLYRLSALRTMAVIDEADDPLRADVERILGRYDNQYDRLVNLLTGMLGSRDQWLGFLLDARHEDGFDRDRLEQGLETLVTAELRQVRELLPEWLLTELPRFLEYAIGNQPEDAERLQELLDHACMDGVMQMPVTADTLPLWYTLIDRLHTQAGEWLRSAQSKHGFPALSRVPATEKERTREWKEGFLALIERLRGEDALRDQLRLVRRLPNPRYEDEAWNALESLGRILLRSAEEWLVVMAETGGADFTEIELRAIEALGGEEAPSELALRLDYRIRHLLVDEFQDTSHGQVRLLKRLTSGWNEGDGHSLFLVGDPMQSIYRFRKAEVSLFIQAFEGDLFRQLQLEPLRLAVNFRSDTPVVDWVNRIFPLVMAPEDDPVSGAVSYNPSTPRPGADSRGQVQMHLFARKDDAREAQRVVDIIRRSDPEQKIAILVSARSHAATTLSLLDGLKQADPRYRYRAVKFTPLGATTLVRDLVSLTLALIQPADRLSWLAVLRAPFAGLELAELDALAGGRDAPVVSDAVRSCLDGHGGSQRLQRAGQVLLDAAGRCGRQPLRSIVENAWLRLGGPACLDNVSELADAATYFDLLSTLEEENLPIDRDSLTQRMQDLYAEPDADASDHLQVMTIYQAKGLQFDTVILPGLNKGTRGDDGRLLHWFELADEDLVVMCPMRDQREKERQKRSGDLIQYISSVEGRRASMENGRLLYVAATRARYDLHLLAAVEPGTKNVIKATAGTLLGELWPAVCDEQVPVIEADAAQLPEPPEPVEALELPQVLRRLPEEWTLPTAPLAIARTPDDPAETPAFVEFRWAGEDARLTGDLVHRLLQSIAEEGLDSWQASGGFGGREAWCRQQLLAAGVRGGKADTVVERTRQALSRAIDSEDGRWILGRHDEEACEYAVTAILDGRPVNLVLDRTFVDNGTRWIIDYKTSVHAGGGLEDFLESEADRYRPQLERYREAMALSETRSIRVALYFPLLDRLVEL